MSAPACGCRQAAQQFAWAPPPRALRRRARRPAAPWLCGVSAHRWQAVEGRAQAESAAPSPGAAEFSAMLSQLRAWQQRYYDCIVPRKAGRPALPPLPLVPLPGGALQQRWPV